VSLATLNGTRLLDNLLAFGQDEFDVAWVGHVWVDTTVGTVCSATLLGGLVDLDVLDDKVAGIETLGIRVCLSVLEKTEQKLSGLYWPSSAGNTELLALRSATSSSSVSSHWDGLLVLLDVLEELYSALQFPSVDSLCCLSGVLEGDTQVRSTRTSGLRWVYLSGGVTDHLDGWRWSLVVDSPCTLR